MLSKAKDLSVKISQLIMWDNLALMILIIFLYLLGLFPFYLSIFGLFFILFFAVALFHPRWVFWYLIGLIAIETVNLAPDIIPLDLRPYQFVALALILALIVKLIAKKFGEFKVKFTNPDRLLAVLIIFSFISSLASTARAESLKQSLVLLSAAVLYFLARVFICSKEDLKKIIPIFLSSGIVIFFYGIWQNWRFAHGFSDFEVMPGRANATFSEPEWFGLYIVSLLAIIYALIYYLQDHTHTLKNFVANIKEIIGYRLIIVLAFVALILTVSRSSWLALFALKGVFLAVVLTHLKFGNWHWKKFLIGIGSFLIVLFLSFGMVKIFNLTNFELAKRVHSTGGYQEITISCQSQEQAQNLPEVIESVEELENYLCRHIDLEEITNETEAGNVVKKILRPDPNVNIRAEIYAKSWEQIKAHPFLGIGFGAIPQVLGSDDLGHGFNASNIFLEVWLGAGLIGLLAFIFFLVHIFIQSLKVYTHSDESFQKSANLFVMLFLLGFVVFNMFNTALLLGFIWIFFGAAVGINTMKNN